MLPVTGMVPVLTELTQGRYPGTGDVARHLFMSVNMVGAIVAAPLAGLASDSLGRRMPLVTMGLATGGKRGEFAPPPSKRYAVLLQSFSTDRDSSSGRDFTANR